MRIHLLREENSHFLEWKIRDFSTGFDVAFCNVTKKEKIQVYYINVTNLTDGEMNGRMDAGKLTNWIERTATMESFVISVSLGTGCYRHIQISADATL